MYKDRNQEKHRNQLSLNCFISTFRSSSYHYQEKTILNKIENYFKRYSEN
jgi:hypothetical protein